MQVLYINAYSDSSFASYSYFALQNVSHVPAFLCGVCRKKKGGVTPYKEKIGKNFKLLVTWGLGKASIILQLHNVQLAAPFKDPFGALSFFARAPAWIMIAVADTGAVVVTVIVSVIVIFDCFKREET